MGFDSPSRFTFYGSPLVDQHIRRDLRLITQYLRERWPRRLVALILMGSYGRGEGGVKRKHAQEYPCDDYDLLPIFDRLKPSQQKSINQALQRVAAVLSCKTACPVDLAPACDVQTLRHVRPTLFWYALRHGHHVIWGNSEVLAVLPEFASTDVPQEESLKLLLHRGVALWQAMEAGFSLSDPWKDPRWNPLLMAMYNAVIAVGDALLLLIHCYHYSYQERVGILKSYLQQARHLPEASMLIYLFNEAVQYRLSPSDYRNLPVEFLIGKLEIVKKIFLDYFFYSLQCVYQSPPLHLHNYAQWLKSLRTNLPSWQQSLVYLHQNWQCFKCWQPWSSWSLQPPFLRFLFCLPYLLSPENLPPGPELEGIFPGCGRHLTLEQLKQSFKHYHQYTNSRLVDIPGLLRPERAHPFQLNNP